MANDSNSASTLIAAVGSDPDFVPAQSPQAATSSDPDFVPAQSQATSSDFVPAQSQAPPQPELPAWQRGVDYINNLGAIAMARGFMKNLEHGAAGTIDTVENQLTGSPVSEAPGPFYAGGGPMGMPTIRVPEGARKAIQTVARPVSDWLNKNTDLQGYWEHLGGAGELIWELLQGQAEARMAKEGAEAASAADMLQEAAKTRKLLDGDSVGSRLARIGLKATHNAAKAGTEVYAQSLIHSQDPDQALKAGATGAVIGGVAGGAGGAYQEGKDILSPTTEMLEGEAMPVLASQRPNAPIATKLIKDVEDLPKFSAVQQRTPPRVIETGSQRAARNVLEDVNQTRQFQGPASQTGIQPGTFTFSVDKYDPRVEAETAEEAAATRQQQTLGTTATTVPTRITGGGPPTGVTMRRQQLGSLASTIPDDIISGTAPTAEKYVTTDPNEVVKLLTETRQLQRIGNLPPRLAARAGARIADLEGQLTDYANTRAQVPNFEPIPDIQKAVAGVHDYETAGELMQNSVRNVYNRMDAATDGEMSKLIQQNRAKALPRMNELFEEHQGEFTKDEWRAASDAYRKGFVAKELHGMLQDGFNMSPEEAATNAQTRRWVGSQDFTRRFDKLMEDHGDDVRSMIGDDGIRNLRRMNFLLRGRETAGPMSDLIYQVARVMRRHGGSVAAFGGGALGTLVGASRYHGALGGVVTAAAVQKVISSMATNLPVADRMAYSVRNGVPGSVAAPIIAALIMSSQGWDQPTSPRPAAQQPPTPETPKEEDRQKPLNRYENPEDQPPDVSMEFNREWTKPDWKPTELPPDKEAQFQKWAKQNPKAVEGELNNPKADYDVRAHWLAGQRGEPEGKLELNKWDGKLHGNDKFKTPYNGTFSNESMFATPDAPHWEGDRLIDKHGRLVADETPKEKK